MRFVYSVSLQSMRFWRVVTFGIDRPGGTPESKTPVHLRGVMYRRFAVSGHWAGLLSPLSTWSAVSGSQPPGVPVSPFGVPPWWCSICTRGPGGFKCNG